jgi:protein involved in polysaccharide export with SLBB domain
MKAAPANAAAAAAAKNDASYQKAESKAAELSEEPRAVKVSYARSDFEQFAEDAAGTSLPVYGRELFDGVPSTFAPVDRMPVPANYTVGPGDELLIRIWGHVELETKVIVDRNGQIALPKIGVLNVAGLRYEQLESYLRSSIAAMYKDFELSVSLGQLRSIQVFVLGNARQPGVYTLGSLSTLVNALFASGGPSATGSMRHIQLRRGDHLVTEFDIYDLQQKGDKSHDVQLLPGDVIYIPTVGPQVALIGNVSRPAIYELKNDTTIASALEGAGGLTTMAGAGRILLERIENHRRRRIDEFDLNQTAMQHVLRDGDLLRIFSISQQFENAVTLRGNVASPGRYVWREGMRISDLIPSRDYLITVGHWNQQNHIARESSPDMMADISASNAEIDWDYAAIERLDQRDLSTRLIPFNLGNALDNRDSADNQVLKVGDVITVYSRKDIALPISKHAAFVRIGGEVNAPGVYRVNPGDTLQTLVGRAGGPTPQAYLFGAVLTRSSARDAQQEQINLEIARLQNEIASTAAGSAVASAGATTGSLVGTQNASLAAAQQSLLAQLSATKPTGRVVLNIRPNASSIADVPNMELEDGDSLLIPARLSTVQVFGAVYNGNAFRFQATKPLYAYLNDAGGTTRTADVRRILLVRADGTLICRDQHRKLWNGNFEKLKLYPGDAIIVPDRIKTPGVFWTVFPGVAQMLTQTAMTGAVLGSLF